MPKGFKLERVTGVVALSYLVLIPAAVYVGYRKIQDLNNDIDVLWDTERVTNKALPLRPGLFRARYLLDRLFYDKTQELHPE